MAHALIADTDVLIDYLHGKQPGAIAVRRQLAENLLAVTAVTRFELLESARQPSQRALVEELLQVTPTLVLDADSADRAAQVSRDLQVDGAPLDMADCLIAGIALTSGEALLTRNRRHFGRVPGLALADAGPGDEVHEPDADP